MKITRRRQAGVSLFGLLIILILLGVVALVAMKVFPSVVEYRGIVQAVKTAANAGSVAEIQSQFGRSSIIADIDSIGPSDLDIKKESSGGYTVSFAYDKKIPLFGPVSLVIAYAGSSKSE